MENNKIATMYDLLLKRNHFICKRVSPRGTERYCIYSDTMQPFETNVIPLNSADCIYTITDGFADQFGGPKGKKFKYMQLRELLLSINDNVMQEQFTILNESFENWKGDLEQVDDVCVIGLKI